MSLPGIIPLEAARSGSRSFAVLKPGGALPSVHTANLGRTIHRVKSLRPNDRRDRKIIDPVGLRMQQRRMRLALRGICAANSS